MSGLEVVVERAQRVQLIEPSVSGLCPRLTVVVLGPGTPATFDGAAGLGPGQGDALSGSGAAAKVRDVDHVRSAGDDQVQDRLSEQAFGDRHRDRADAADLAEFVAVDPASAQRLDVDP
jgi:hypothetical protein